MKGQNKETIEIYCSSSNREKHWENIILFGNCWLCGLGKCKAHNCNASSVVYDEEGNGYCEEHIKIFT